MFSLLWQVIEKFRRSGSNRHGALAPPDFESENRSPSVYHYVPLCGLGKRNTWLSRGRTSGCVRVCPPLYCCHIAAITAAASTRLYGCWCVRHTFRTSDGRFKRRAFYGRTKTEALAKNTRTLADYYNGLMAFDA